MGILRAALHLPRLVKEISQEEGIPNILKYVIKSVGGIIFHPENHIGSNGPIFVFVPGFASTASTLVPLAMEFRQAGLNTVHLENFAGLSMGSLRKKEILLDEQLHILEQHFPDREIILVGHSMGGHMAVRAINRHREWIQRIIILSAALQPNHHAKKIGLIPSLRDLGRFPDLTLPPDSTATIYVGVNDSLVKPGHQIPKQHHPKAQIYEMGANHLDILTDSPFIKQIAENARSHAVQNKI